MVGRNRTLSVFALALSALFGPSRASALGLVGAPNERLESPRMDAVVWMSGPEEETLVESIVVAPGAKRFALLRAFPRAPKEIAPIDPLVLINLEVETRTLEPYHLAVKRNLFGPSVLTPLSLAVLGQPSGPSEEALPPVRVAPPTPAFATFNGKVKTTTTSGARILPADLRGWLLDARVELTNAQHDAVAAALLQGWTVVGTVIQRPDPTQPLMVGPILYRFAARRPTLPAFLTPNNSMPQLRLYALGDAPHAPLARGWVWDEEPWTHDAPPNAEGSAVISRWSPLPPRAAIALTRVIETRAPPARVLRVEQRERQPAYAAITLDAVPSARAIPGRSGRGSWLDVLLSALLGAAPLLYAPESWLLLWFAERARSSRRPKDPPTLAESLWPIYALVVAAFWMVAMPGAARAAAIAPLALAAWRLLFTEKERERGPVRVDFRRKAARLDKKPEKKPEGAAPDVKTPAPVTGVVGGPKTPLPVRMALAKAPAAMAKPGTIPTATKRGPLSAKYAALAAKPNEAGKDAAASDKPGAPKTKTEPAKTPAPVAKKDEGKPAEAAKTPVPAKAPDAQKSGGKGKKGKKDKATPARSVMPVKKK